MGHIHDTGDPLLGFESRSESVILHATEDHVFIPWERPANVLKIAGDMLKVQAGQAFASDNDAEAKRLRQIPEDLQSLEIEGGPPDSFEVSKEWLRSLVKFVNDNPGILDET